MSPVAPAIFRGKFIVCLEVSRDKSNISVWAPVVVPVAYKIFPCLISNVDIKTVLFGPL